LHQGNFGIKRTNDTDNRGITDLGHGKYYLMLTLKKEEEDTLHMFNTMKI